ncbi:MAG: VOC family protein [Candidatus Aminicenantes bacterium]|nr:VOC family protein [Candidatus Aminicenantes bacterium]
MIKNIDHIAIKVTDLSRVSSALKELGIPCKSIETFKEVGMRIAFLGGKKEETGIELLEVIDQNSPIADEKPGLNHMALKVEDIENIYREMKKSDRFTVEGEIRQGAHSRIFFFRIKGQEEVLFECVE